MKTFARWMIGLPLVFVPLAAALAEDDPTAASVAALKASVGKAPGFEVGEVRVTHAGISCIDYTVRSVQGGKTPGHAVVQSGEVLRADQDATRFEEAWNKHCLGPRGGMQPSE